MSDKSGDKTEKPTPHSLKKARERGQVAKGRDIGLVLGMLFALLLLWLIAGQLVDRARYLTELSINLIGEDFITVLPEIGREAAHAFLLVSAIWLLPLAVFQVVIEYLQAGPIFTAERMKPRMENLNPAEGIKRIFSAESLFDLGKSIVQVCVLFGIAWLVFESIIGEVMLLPWGEPRSIVESVLYIGVRVLGWTLLAYFLLMFVDTAFQHYSFMRRMMMSRRDIRQEQKDLEGDPQIKQSRRQTALEWSQEGATQAARDANVLVVNPTHIAVAILYDKEETRVPLMTARGEDEQARIMREAAELAGTPILRNEPLARALLHAETQDDVVPRELFNIVAEVILWAKETRERVTETREGFVADRQEDVVQREAPGEDLTCYDTARLDHLLI
ncbi:MAG: EscU/YscU/HrcU family type III secretion system export apparatus switch protein [Gammaproteobacteria bacterium]|nr:MAG: EscU/YscU/HrcU family type III secretion system export apparatus switch protein [Gammaproteobacteria bacterium]